MNLSSPITRLPKVGPKYKNLLQNLEITTIGDLLYHFPFRYEDLTATKNISDLIENDVVTIKATLNRVDNIFTRNRKKITKAVFNDETGKINAIWFNMHYLKRSLFPGKTYFLSGKVGKFGSALTLIAPILEEEKSENESLIHTGRLVPIYSETAGISSKWLRTRISEVLSVLAGSPELTEFLPDQILSENEFISFEEGLNLVHFPNSMEEVNKARDRFSYEEVFLELLRVETRKTAWQQKFESFTLNLDKDKNSEVEKFYKSLPFSLTESQTQAIREIFEDLATNRPMNRLLEGDTGAGKTIVAIISAYFAYLNGYKTLYMAPTEILARQHFETFSKYLDKFGVKLSLKTSNKKNFQTDSDIIIGTHALLYVEEKVENVGLIVIDEQQRFGVEQRAKLLELGTKGKIPHLLTMTATPIPRTLALTLYGDLDISSIKPHKPLYENIETRIISEKDRDLAYENAAKQNVPIFVVCPLIEASNHETMLNVKSAEEEYERLKSGPFKDLRVGLLHGRMSSLQKDTVVEAFKTGKTQVLVSTPVIEVGIDIPDATIIMIESAERYGLASLHQLRGRIGRGGQKAYCLLFLSKYSKNAFSRLENLKKHHDGLKLAQIDLELRGQGDLYGTQQHGFVQFKIADPTDIKLLEKAKEDAEKFFGRLDKFKNLKSRVERMDSAYAIQN